jgi:hypothetical protein
VTGKDGIVDEHHEDRACEHQNVQHSTQDCDADER